MLEWGCSGCCTTSGRECGCVSYYVGVEVAVVLSVCVLVTVAVVVSVCVLVSVGVALAVCDAVVVADVVGV